MHFGFIPVKYQPASVFMTNRGVTSLMVYKINFALSLMEGKSVAQLNQFKSCFKFKREGVPNGFSLSFLFLSFYSMQRDLYCFNLVMDQTEEGIIS